MGKLHTCYAPVRRSPSNKASIVHAAPRLACVKPIASVHPEPGSNSSLYIYFFIRLSLNSSFIVVKNRRWYFIYHVLILHFCCFQSFKELVSVCVETDCKVTTFFWIDKIFQKKYLFFLFKHLLFNSQATSLDCGCKVTAFSQTTKIFLNFFINFFISHCTSKRKIFIFLRFLWVLCHY